MMTEGKTADSSPRNQPRKSFWDRSGATGSPSRTRTYNLAVNSHYKKVRQLLRLKSRRETSDEKRKDFLIFYLQSISCRI